MGNGKNNTGVAGKSISDVQPAQQSVLHVEGYVEVDLHPPLFYKGGTLGYADASKYAPVISLADSRGQRCFTESIEWVLQHLDYFDARCQTSLLASVAAHYGFKDVNTLVKGRMQ
jgi:hypothetical protein